MLPSSATARQGTSFTVRFVVRLVLLELVALATARIKLATEKGTGRPAVVRPRVSEGRTVIFNSCGLRRHGYNRAFHKEDTCAS
jgi:hypothetical protein